MTNAIRIPARPTVYDGIKMRSRLEAKFAACLDRIYGKGSWAYEPRCYASHNGQYLPDFEVLQAGTDRKRPYFIEVKPASITAEEVLATLAKMMLVWSSEPTALLNLVVMGTDDQRWTVFFGQSICDCGTCMTCTNGIRWYVDALDDSPPVALPLDKDYVAELLDRQYGTDAGVP